MKMSPENRKELDQVNTFLQRHPGKLQAINQVAMHLLQRGLPLDDALQAYERYLAEHPASANAAYNHAWYLGRDGQFQAAIRMYRRALELGIDQPEEVHLNIGNLYMDHVGDAEKACEAFQQALAINPGYFGAHFNLGNLAEQNGDREQATAFFEKCLKIEPGNPTALARLADAHKFRERDDPLLARLLASARNGDDSDLLFALGSAFNQLADYDSAWRYFSRANALDRKALPPYDRERTEATVDRIISQSTADWLARYTGASDQSVFICGLFRTGSTLLEQILAAHPRFAAGGESEFFPRLVSREYHDYPSGLEETDPDELRRWCEEYSAYSRPLTDGARRLTDKRPDNFLYAGLIKAILPSAKFVVTERDWRDVALSIFSMRLGAAQNYSTDLADIRHYIGQHKRLVGHWASLLGDDLLRVSYEDLVTRSRETVGNLLRALGEEWDERCLTFHERESTVKTGSVWQVREPIHARSISRWENYRPYFEEVFGPDGVS
jgi:tetratricopeptide (TPR) repeat protein